MNNTNKDFFSELDKELPPSSYKDRFAEELESHLEDAVEDSAQKGLESVTAKAQALRNLGDTQTLSRAYIQRLRPDLLLSAYFDSLVTGSVATIFCLSYFFLSVTGFFREKAGDPNSWIAWVFYLVIPFLFFLIFYSTSLTSSFKRPFLFLSPRLVSIIAALPFITVLSISTVTEKINNGNTYYPSLFIHAIPTLAINYLALSFAAYIIIRGFKTIPFFLSRAGKYIKYSITVTAGVYLVCSSIIPHLYPHADALWMFLSLRTQLDIFIETALGIGIHLTNNVMYEVWVLGLLFILIGVFCLIRLILYAYNKKLNYDINFPSFTLLLLTYIALLFIVPPAKNSDTPINWLRPAANVIEVIEKKQTGPLYNWFLNIFKDKSGYSISGINIIDGNFIIHREGPDYINIIKNIKSVNNFDIETQALSEGDILRMQQRIATPSSITGQGFSCTTPYNPLESVPELFSGSDSDVVACTSLLYKTTPIFSGDIPYTVFTTRVDSQKKWALIDIGGTSMNGWFRTTGIYLVQLP